MTTTIAPASGAGILFTQQGIGTTPGYSALDLRRSEVVGPIQEGVYAAGDYMVTQRGAGANMSVDIAAGSGAFAAVQGDSVTGQGLYVVGPHSAAAINETIAAADPSNPRIDSVILEIQDNVHDASGGNLARTRVLTGTPTGGATLTNRSGFATLPGNALLLADVLVTAGGVSVSNTQIRDRRKWARGAYTRILRNSANYTTSSASFAVVDGTNLSPRVECSGLPLRLTLRSAVSHSAASGQTALAITVDGVLVDGASGTNGWQEVGAPTAVTKHYVRTWDVVPSAGSHLLAPYWAIVTAGTATLWAQSTDPLLFTIEEVVRQNTANNTTTTG